MHPYFSETMLRDNERHLDRSLRTAYLRREPQPGSARPAEPVLLRLSSVQDDDALALLAALEGLQAPKGQQVVAEVGGEIVAALPLGPGPALADPFRPTAHLMPLLELRAKQLTDDRPRRRSIAIWGAVQVLEPRMICHRVICHTVIRHTVIRHAVIRHAVTLAEPGGRKSDRAVTTPRDQGVAPYA